jgi:hypothetical protein
MIAGCTAAITVALGLELVGLEVVSDLLVALVVLLLFLFLDEFCVRDLERDLKLYVCSELILI